MFLDLDSRELSQERRVEGHAGIPSSVDMHARRGMRLVPCLIPNAVCKQLSYPIYHILCAWWSLSKYCMFIVGFVLVAIVKKRYIEEYPLLECPFYLFDVWFGINLEFERRVFLVNVFFFMDRFCWWRAKSTNPRCISMCFKANEVGQSKFLLTSEYWCLATQWGSFIVFRVTQSFDMYIDWWIYNTRESLKTISQQFIMLL